MGTLILGVAVLPLLLLSLRVRQLRVRRLWVTPTMVSIIWLVAAIKQSATGVVLCPCHHSCRLTGDGCPHSVRALRIRRARGG